jgi:choice-of-anchor C domain-containing protein
MIGSLLVAALLQAGGAGPRAVPARPASLLLNGGFEEGPSAGRFVNLAGGSEAIKGWAVTGEGVDYIGTLWPGSEGAHSIDLDGSVRSATTRGYVHGGVAQTFATKPGTGYLVTFDLAGNPYAPPAKKLMRVSAADQSQDFSFDVTGKTPTKMGWTPTRWSFTANSASTTLEFRSLTPARSTGWGAVIDNVSVTVLPADQQQLEVTESAKEIEVRMGAEILFATAEYTLRPAAAPTLERLAALLKEHPGLPILIQGHTDNVGSPESNLLLSERRALAVKDWLVSQAGMAATAISTKGLGETAPVATNSTAAGRQKNRRVEIRLEKSP